MIETCCLRINDDRSDAYRVGESVGLATGWSWVRIPLRQLRFGTLAIPFTPHCQCLSKETIKAVGPFYLVSMPGEVKDPTSPHWKCVTCRGLHHSIWLQHPVGSGSLSEYCLAKVKAYPKCNSLKEAS